jgi:hypothetical protein
VFTQGVRDGSHDSCGRLDDRRTVVARSSVVVFVVVFAVVVFVARNSVVAFVAVFPVVVFPVVGSLTTADPVETVGVGGDPHRFCAFERPSDGTLAGGTRGRRE